MNIEQQIKAALNVIMTAAPGSQEAKRAGYDLVTLRHKQNNPEAYFKGGAN